MVYEDFYKSDFGKYALENEAKYVANLIKNDALSIGCGTGLIEKEIKKMTEINIMCIEKDENMIEKAKKNLIAINGKAENLPFHNKRFDAIIFITSLEFIDDYKKAIKEAARVLKNNGIFIAIMLNTNSKYFKERYKKGGYIKRNIQHLETKKIEKEAEKFFKIEHEYILCMNMKENCKNEEKALYVIKGILNVQ